MKLLSTAAAMLLPFAVMGQSYIGMFDHNPLERSDKRVLQYTPTSDGYIMSHNGKNLYTRALYGGNTAFRMETSDMPIFAGFHGKDNRNIHFVLDVDGVKMRLDSVSDCRSYYRGGERRYELADAAWRGGRIVMTLLAPRDYEGGIWKIEAAGMPKGSTLTAVSCATVKIKLNRNGDMGADPANCLAPDPERGDLTECTVNLGGKKQTVYIGYADRVVTAADQKKLAAAYAKADRQRADLAGMLEVETPDPYFNTLGATIM
ncbi:MAG: DUF4450 domain-containing protein, partial [Duncaniella sp.]|nr:DUF4450 domain-containing protein [Duncaniella sp.]